MKVRFQKPVPPDSRVLQMLTRTFRIYLFTLATAFWLGSIGSAQDMRGPWQEALRLVDSASPADIVAAISKLEAVVSTEHTVAPPPGALTTLALCQLRQQDYDAAARTLKRLATEYTAAQLQPRRGALLRMSLIVALAREDAAAADTISKTLSAW